MAITALPPTPSREDPDNFADRADALAAALVTFVTEANALQADVNDKQTTASAAAGTATTKAGEAASARDIAFAAVNYKGLWSSLSGALNVPASVFHSGSIWLLKENVASVGAETPGVSTKWMNVTPASGLGTAAYSNATDFQPAIGALTGLLQSAGGGTISAATAAQIVAAIGSVYVANATHATSADSADSATTIMDGAVSSASKIANGVITLAKMAAMTTGKLIGRSTSGGGSPEEISIGTNLTLSGGVLNATGSVTSVNGLGGAVTVPAGSQTFTSSGTFTVPDGVTSVRAVIRGGGGGGGCDYLVNGPTGGGNGGRGAKIISGLTPGGTISVTIGAGGAGASFAAKVGSTGGTSSFGAHLSATGGTGGRAPAYGYAANGTCSSDVDMPLSAEKGLGGAYGDEVTGGTAGTAGFLYLEW